MKSTWAEQTSTSDNGCRRKLFDPQKGGVKGSVGTLVERLYNNSTACLDKARRCIHTNQLDCGRLTTNPLEVKTVLDTISKAKIKKKSILQKFHSLRRAL
jgi:hypothetical protein